MSPATTIEASGVRHGLPHRSGPCGADLLLLARCSRGLPERAVSSASLADARSRRPGACRLSTRCTQHAGGASISSERLGPLWTASKIVFGLLGLFARCAHLARRGSSPSRAPRAAQSWRACGISTPGLRKPPTTAEAGSGAAGGAPGPLSAHTTLSNHYQTEHIPMHASTPKQPNICNTASRMHVSGLGRGTAAQLPGVALKNALFVGQEAMTAPKSIRDFEALCGVCERAVHRSPPTA